MQALLRLCGFVVAVLFFLAAVSPWEIAAAQTKWPAFMPQLEAGPSLSPVAAKLPDDLVVEPPAAGLSPEKAR